MVLVAIFAAGLIASGAVAGVGPLAAFSALSSAADETGTDSTSTDTTETTSTEPTDTGTTETTTSEEAPTSPSPPSGPPTVSSDKPDYAPGERVTLTGANWYSGETVHINVNDDVGQSWTRNVDVIANASGEITDQFNLPDWFVATYTVIANGAISGTVRTTFTDGNIRFATSGPTLTGIAWQRHNGTTCSNPLGGGNSGTGDLTSDPTATLQLGDNNNQSLQLTVPVTASCSVVRQLDRRRERGVHNVWLGQPDNLC